MEVVHFVSPAFVVVLHWCDGNSISDTGND